MAEHEVHYALYLVKALIWKAGGGREMEYKPNYV